MPDNSQNSIESALMRRLSACYPQADAAMVASAVTLAKRGLETTQLAEDSASDKLLAIVAERELRLRLRLDAEDARLDPQRRPGTGQG